MMKYLPVVLFVAMLVGIAVYFGRARLQPVTRMETNAALIWLIVRRVVCFGAAIVLFALAGVAVYYFMYRASSVSAPGMIGLVLVGAFGFILVHLGLYGTGDRRFDVTDDKPTHELRKNRYGWRW